MNHQIMEILLTAAPFIKLCCAKTYNILCSNELNKCNNILLRITTNSFTSTVLLGTSIAQVCDGNKMFMLSEAWSTHVSFLQMYKFDFKSPS